ncbi:FtsX-like permease family protein [Mycolicibacter heraklionensis]|uniref:ABC transporter permease n=1 Tax=Mycolicibacter heraklionensis TaxID=512402 RepID=A0AA91EXU4_9MYCO|nr:FtsX-like permease family protein [Mycolicibacter heraklionensis]OBK82817.1 ABC transporter permease [Mycolicibacter heraklionensis]
MARGTLAATFGLLRIINFRAVRKHAFRAALAAFSLGGGVAVVVAVMIEVTSVSKAVEDVGYQIAGPAPLRVVGAATRGGISPAVVEDSRAVPGVAAVVPVIRGVTMIRNDGKESFGLGLGVDCSAQWIVDPKVCQTGQAEPPPAISKTLGDSLDASATLVTDVGQLSMEKFQRVADLDDVNNGLVAVLPLSMAKVQFARGDRVDMLYVTLDSGANADEVQQRLKTTLGPTYSVQPRSEPAKGYNVNDVLLPLLGIFALISIGVGVILITQITRLSVEERRREIAIASALGASPASIMTGFLSEAALLGAVGSAMGVLTGIVISEPIVASASELTERFVGVTVPVILKPAILVIGVLAGILLAVGAAIGPALSASNTPIAAELSGRAAQEQTTQRKIWFKALLLLAIGLSGVIAARLATLSGALVAWQAMIADAGAVVALIGLLLATAYLSAQAITSLRPRPDKSSGATLTIALNALRSDRSRTAAISGAIAVPVVVAILLSGFLVAIHIGATKVAESQADGRIAITTTQFADYGPIDARFAPQTVNKLNSVAGVEKTERMAEIEISLKDGSLAHIQAQDRPTFPFGLLAGQSPEASQKANQVVIGSVLAREKNLHIGDTLVFGSGLDAQAMSIGTIVATPEYGGRRIYMPYAVAEQIYGPQPAGLIFATPESGFSAGQVIENIKAAQFDQPLTAVDTDGYAADIAASIGRYLTPLNTLKYGLLAIAFISVLSTLLLVGIRRRREVALIQALGATRLRVFSITTIEAVVAGAAGGLFGAVLAIAISEAVRRAAVVNVGLVTPLVFPWTDAVVYAVLATVAAVFAAIIPAWKSTRSTPATELRDE